MRIAIRPMTVSASWGGQSCRSNASAQMRRTGFGQGGTAAALICAAILSAALFPAALAQDAAPPAPATRTKSKAQKPGPAQDAAAPAVKDPAAAMAAYSSGVKAYQAGKFDAAVASMNAAVQGGGLPSNLLAKALYYRGAAFQQQGKPGQAISDLTSALWLKGGLDEAERAEATKYRASAYRDAGLGESGQAPAGSSAGAADAGGLNTGSIGPAPGPQLSAFPPEGPTEPASGLGIGNLFGNLFGGSKPGQVAAAPAQPPAVAPPAPPAPAGAQAAGGEPEVLPWAKSSAATSAPAPAKPAGKPVALAASKKAGAYRIQVAAVKSRDEASAIISKVQALGGAVAAAGTTVDEATFGSMGTFYRVRLGPFANAAATKAPCSALKASGLDCLVTAK